MDAPAPPQPFFFRALDLPAREALELGRRGVLASLAPAAVGLGVVALSSLATDALAPVHPIGLAALRALLVAMVTVVPGTAALVVHRKLSLGPRGVLAAVSVASLVAGVASAALLPLIAYVRLVARAGAQFLGFFPLLVALVGLAAIALVPGRVMRAIDPRPASAAISYLYGHGLVAVFAFELWPVLHTLLGSWRF